MAKELQRKFEKDRVDAEAAYRKKLNSLLNIDSDPLTDPKVMRSAQASADNEREQGLLQIQRNIDAQRMAEERQAARQKKMEGKMDATETRRRDQEAASMFKKQTLSEGGLPDLTGDGKITQADVLKGRGVFQEGGSLMIAREKYGLGSLIKKSISKAMQSSKSTSKEAYPGEAGDIRDIEEFEKILSTPNKDAIFFSKEKLNALKKDIDAQDAYAEMLGEFVAVRQQDDEIIKMAEALNYGPKKTKSILVGNKKGIDKLRRNFNALSEKRLSEAENRSMKAEGSLMMPEEGMPIDTYSNIPADEMDEAIESQLPDVEMEEDYISYVMDESLNDDEQDYLVDVLQKDPRLSDILDKVITTASEFSGAGEVEGPGTGVSDSIPARLSDGEFVFTKKATDQLGADQLQVMMDDAERVYDGGVMMAEGGMMDEEDLGMSKTKEEIEKLMMGANRMPSIR